MDIKDINDPDSWWDDMCATGTLYSGGCTQLDSDGTISITVLEGYMDRDDPVDTVILDCQHGDHGTRYTLDPDLAEALAKMLLSAAKTVRRNALLRNEIEME